MFAGVGAHEPKAGVVVSAAMRLHELRVGAKQHVQVLAALQVANVQEVGLGDLVLLPGLWLVLEEPRPNPAGKHLHVGKPPTAASQLLA